MIKIRFAAIMFIFAALLLCGCAYKFAGGGELPGAVRKVSISVLENKTAESGIQNIITNDLIYEFTRNGKVVAKIDDAEAYLTGTIESANDEAISHKGDHTSLERRVKVVLGLKLKDRSGNIIWTGKDISADQAFAVMGDKIETEKQRRTAIEVLSKRLAEKVYNRMTDNF
ncbi:MAG: hypothetical protein EHM85_07990 [Desulfobacteraceae bacterium]|nr:MAG: hypothetical protein EHM85_07990 [Desulfobacteraceae bacterium]